MKSSFTITLTALTCLVGLLSTVESQEKKPPAPNIQTIEATNATKEKAKKKEKDKPDPNSARIFLTNGDKLRGKVKGFNAQGEIIFDADSLKQTVTFPLNHILSLNLDGWKEPDKNNKPLARIKLYHRFSESQSDTLIGSLHELTEDHINLKTWYGGIISLKRSMVKSLKILNQEPGNFYGPNNLKEWTLPSGKGTWKFANGSLVSRADGGIGRDVGLTEKSQVSFDVVWKKSMRFHLMLYSSDISKERPSAYYDLNLSSYMSMRTVGKIAKGQRPFGGGRGQMVRQLPNNNQAHFDIFCDRKNGSFIVYIDGKQVTTLQSTRPDPEDLGTGISFIATEHSPIEVSAISITSWNGSTLPNQINPIENIAKPSDDDKEKPPHHIILNNGDKVPGTVGKVLDDGHMVIETEFTPIKIPIKYIKSMTFGDAGEQPKRYKGDVRAWFYQGGHITLKLISIQDGNLTGFGQAIGKVSLDLSAFSRIDFHIYDPKANELRKEMR